MNIKKLTALAVTTVLVLTALTASAASFTDIRGHWAEDVINNLADKGVVNGVSDTQFNPDGTVTRAEFVKMALAAANIPTAQYREDECLDVRSGAWYGDYIQSALDCGLIPEGMIENYSAQVVTETDDEGNVTSAKAVYDGAFNAESPITREEMAYIAQASYQYSLGAEAIETLEVPADLDFDDMNVVSIWALDGLKHAYANNLISGMGDGTFRPHATATRAQAAVIINNMLNK